MLRGKKPVFQGYILYDSIFITRLKCQKCRDGEQVSGLQGQEADGREVTVAIKRVAQGSLSRTVGYLHTGGHRNPRVMSWRTTKHTCTHTYTHVHIHTYTYIHTYTDAHTHTHTRVPMKLVKSEGQFDDISVNLGCEGRSRTGGECCGTLDEGYMTALSYFLLYVTLEIFQNKTL